MARASCVVHVNNRSLSGRGVTGEQLSNSRGTHDRSGPRRRPTNAEMLNAIARRTITVRFPRLPQEFARAGWMGSPQLRRSPHILHDTDGRVTLTYWCLGSIAITDCSRGSRVKSVGKDYFWSFGLGPRKSVLVYRYELGLTWLGGA